jgi:hypothetical protein
MSRQTSRPGQLARSQLAQPERPMGTISKRVRLAGADFGGHRHACAFFQTKDEEYRLLLPFVKDGLERNSKSYHIVEPSYREQHLQRLAQAGIDVVEAEQRGRLEVRSWDELYLLEGHFDQNRMLTQIEEVLSAGKARGFGLTRLWANMEWALEKRPGVAAILEYEARLNYVLPKYADPVVCSYDLSRFDAGIVMNILRTHPSVIIGGILQKNPFFVTPDAMLRELQAQPDGLGLIPLTTSRSHSRIDSKS